MSSNEFNLIRIEALEKRIQELEIQLKIKKANEKKETISPSRFKNINTWR